MSSLSQTKLDDVVNACGQGAAEAAEALGRALDAALTVTVGQPVTLALDALPAGWAGPGLVAVLKVGTQAALVLLPEDGGLVPAWSKAPDATGTSRLTTLAQELGMILLPPDLLAEDFQCQWLENLGEAARRAGLPPAAPVVPLELSAGDGRRGAVWLVWPAGQPEAVYNPAAAKPAAVPAAQAPQAAAGAKPVAAAKPAAKPAAAAKPAPAMKPKVPGKSVAPPKPAPPKAKSPRDLPEYSQSLLRISIPVVVTLAHNKQPLGRIIELGPGSIIHFDKSCEEMLDMEVGGRTIAAGEAVKVGDKFGLRITSIVLPEERFKPVPPTRKRA